MYKIKKVVATDLDGTIVNRNNQISMNTINLIKEFKEKTNHALTFVTGRNYFLTIDHAKTLDIKLPLITTNGISVIDPFTHSYIDKLHFFNEELISIVDILHKKNFKYSLLGDFEVHLVKDAGYVMEFKEIKWDFSHKKDKAFNVYNNYEELYKHIIKLESFPSINVECFTSQEKEDVYNALKNLDIEIISFNYNKRTNIEIYKKGAGKDWGIRALLKHFNLSDEDVHVFGDEFNDYPMFKVFPNSYAMGNAIDGIKKLSKEVIDSIDNDGVGKKITELIEEFI